MACKIVNYPKNLQSRYFIFSLSIIYYCYYGIFNNTLCKNSERSLSLSALNQNNKRSGAKTIINNITNISAEIYYPPFVMRQLEGKSGSIRKQISSDTKSSHAYLDGFAPKQSDGRYIPFGRYKGFLIEIYNILASRLNFSMRLMILPSDESLFGIDEGDGTFSGLVGYLQRQEADLALSGFMMTESRLAVMDFSEPVAHAKYRLYIKQDVILHRIGWKTYVRSFNLHAWTAFVVLFVMASFTLWFLMIWQTDEDAYFKRGANITFMLFSCIVQQGSPSLPLNVKSQAVLWLFWITSIIFYAAYTARITSFLAVSGDKLPFTSLKEATSTPGWKIGVLNGTAALKVLQRSKRESYVAVTEGLRRDPSLLVMSDEEGMRRIMREEMFAYFGEDVVMSYYLNTNCSFRMIPGSHLEGFMHMGFRKNLPYAEVINVE
ncbi:hypothetical protein SK128_020521 [Halocaridina rubra]|uniref:Uncharacterized protein n=1 Tax=Halocaridina rubra TaxID=373956 RepID=A0AAN8WZI7_HALRR